MAWAKFDDRWATHPKLLAAGLEAKGLDASGICYAAGQETDGFVSDRALVILCAGHRSPHKVAGRLVEVGRWTRDEERKGYVIHDFDRYNFTRQQGEAKRARDAERKAAARARQGRDANGRITSSRTDDGVQPDDAESPPGFQDESARTPTPVPPVPTRPDPTRIDKSSSSDRSAAPGGAEEEELRTRTATAARLVAERRLKARNGEPITDRAGWLRKVAARVLYEHGQALTDLAGRGLNAAAMADAVDPTVAPSPHRAWEPPAESEDDAIVEPDDARRKLAELRRGA